MSIDRMSLQGQVAIVTGSRGGLGKAIALAFAEAGADVAICDIKDDGGEMDAVVKQIEKLGRRAIAVQVDLTKKDQVENLVNRVEAELGPVDILMNNAGGHIRKPYEEGFFTPFYDLAEEEWDAVFDMNFKTCLLCTQAVCKGMIKRKTGKIINMSSIGALLGEASAFGCAEASKNRFTKGAAFDLGKYNIRVNAIEPGSTASHPEIKTDSIIQMQKRWASMAPLGKVGAAEDVAKCALFLASDASSHITGEIIRVDGGYTLGFMQHAPH